MSDPHLRTALQSLHDRVPFTADAVPAVQPRPSGDNQRHMVPLLGAAALIGLCVAGLVIVGTNRAPNDASLNDRRVENATPWAAVIPDPPIEPRQDPLIVDAGDALLVWGGHTTDDDDERTLTDGALFKPASSTWIVVSQAPALGEPIAGVWIEPVVIVIGSTGAAQYSPEQDAWTPLDVPGGTASIEHAVSVSNELVLLPPMVAYDTATEVWRNLDAPNEFPDEATVAVADDDVVVYGTVPDGAIGGVGLRYDTATDRWGELPPVPFFQFTPGDGVGVVGNDLLIVSSLTQNVAALDLNDTTWRELPTYPELPGICRSEVLAVRDVAIVSGCNQTAVLAPGAAQWIPFDAPTGSTLNGLHHLGDDLVINGIIFELLGNAWWQYLATGPATYGNVTIDRDMVAAEVAEVRTGLVGVKLLSGECRLDVTSPNDAAQRRLIDAIPASGTIADFSNQYGTSELRCESRTAFDTVLEQLSVRGDFTDPIRGELEQDVTGAFDDQNELVERVLAVLEDRHSDRVAGVGVAVSAPYGEPTHYRFDVIGPPEDGEIGLSYEVTLDETSEGWTIASSTQQIVCEVGVDAAEPGQCMIPTI